MAIRDKRPEGQGARFLKEFGNGVTCGHVEEGLKVAWRKRGRVKSDLREIDVTM